MSLHDAQILDLGWNVWHGKQSSLLQPKVLWDWLSNAAEPQGDYWSWCSPSQWQPVAYTIKILQL